MEAQGFQHCNKFVSFFTVLVQDGTVYPSREMTGSHGQLENRIWIVGESPHSYAEPAVPSPKLSIFHAYTVTGLQVVMGKSHPRLWRERNYH